LGQLKSAYALARECGTVGAVLNRLYQRVFAAAKRVRTETAIGENPVSVAYAAVDLAGRIYESMASVNVLLVGAGETIELVGTHLRQAGINRMLIANRSLDRGLSLAKKLGAEACVLGDLPEVLPQVDIVVSSTASQLPIIGKGLVETALRKRRHEPMLFIDIAVPRDVESEVAELHDVYLYTVDDLRDIVDQNRAQRETEANKAREILNQELVLYTRSRRADASKPWIKYYRDQAFALTDLELERARKELGAGADPEAVLESMARAITNKLIHAPSQGLRSIAEQNVAELDVAKRLLGLPDELDQ
jgi:glutamyl-tRNA reductase